MKIRILFLITILSFKKSKLIGYIWTPPSLSELSSMIYDMELTHLGSEAFISYCITNTINFQNNFEIEIVMIIIAVVLK